MWANPNPNPTGQCNEFGREAGLRTGPCEDAFNGWAGSLGNRIVNGVVKERVKVRPRASSEDEFFFFSSDTPLIELPVVFRIAVPLSWNLSGYISFCSLHFGRPSVDCAGRHLSVCPIQRFPQLVVSGSSQHGTIQGSFPSSWIFAYEARFWNFLNFWPAPNSNFLSFEESTHTGAWRDMSRVLHQAFLGSSISSSEFLINI